LTANPQHTAPTKLHAQEHLNIAEPLQNRQHAVAYPTHPYKEGNGEETGRRRGMGEIKEEEMEGKRMGWDEMGFPISVLY